MSSTQDVSLALAGPLAERAALLLAVVEDQWFDRKSVRMQAAALAQHEIGLANADGGTLVIGLADGKVEGVDREPHRLNELMQAHVQYCQPAVPARAELVECLRADGSTDHLLIIDVRAGDTVYANTRDDVFLRIGDETRKLSHQQRQELLYDRGHGSYEASPAGEATSEHIDGELLAAYAKAIGAPDAQRLLLARGLATQSGLTIAGLLLFASHPQRRLPEAFVRVLRYRGTQRGTGARQDLVFDQRAEGPIPSQLVTARELVQQLQPRRRALGSSGRFEDLPLVPEDAWLEGLVNAVVHRSYSLSGDHIRVDIFDDRIEIESPGRFPMLFSTDRVLDAPRYARNPRIARVCADQRFGQELGEGIRRMFAEMRLAGLTDPLYRQTPGSVRLSLLAEPVDRELEARLPRDSRAIVAILRDAGPLSTSEIATAAGVSRITARKRLESLREEGLIVWDGKSPRDPRASWRLPNP